MRRGEYRINKLLAIVFIVALSPFTGGSSVTYADSESYEESQVKAAFLYNFAKFVIWPQETFPDSISPMTVCILGKDPFGSALEALKEKKVQERHLSIRRVAKIEEIERCNVLFVSESEKDNLAAIFVAARKRHVLTVGDMQGFAQAGGIINLFTRESRIRFEINTDAAERSSLKISSKLLRLGEIVREKN